MLLPGEVAGVPKSVLGLARVIFSWMTSGVDAIVVLCPSLDFTDSDMKCAH